MRNFKINGEDANAQQGQVASGTDTSKFPHNGVTYSCKMKGPSSNLTLPCDLQAIGHQGHKLYLLLIFITYLSFEMIKFSIPKGFLRVCERKEAYEISFFLQDRADGRGQRTRRHRQAPFLVG